MQAQYTCLPVDLKHFARFRSSCWRNIANKTFATNDRVPLFVPRACRAPSTPKFPGETNMSVLPRTAQHREFEGGRPRTPCRPTEPLSSLKLLGRLLCMVRFSVLRVWFIRHLAAGECTQVCSGRRDHVCLKTSLQKNLTIVGAPSYNFSLSSPCTFQMHKNMRITSQAAVPQPSAGAGRCPRDRGPPEDNEREKSYFLALPRFLK